MTNKGILKLPILFILLLALIASCGKDDTPTDDTPVSETPTDDDPGDDDSDDDDTGANTPPIVDDAEFSVDENLAPGGLIGEIVAEDAEQTVLTYAIEAGDDASLFDVDDEGNLTLAADQNLDYESATSHQITVVVGDGSVSVKGDVTINVNDINEAPQLLTDVSTIQVVESIDDTAVIVDLDATDPEDDKFFFALQEDLSGLFQLNEEGVLGLSKGQTLNFDDQPSHTLTISITDTAENQTTVQFTITVLEVVPLKDDPASFVTTWVVGGNQTLTIGTNEAYTYNYQIDWGDDTVEVINTNDPPFHQYENSGEYTVIIKGDFPAIQMSNAPYESRKALTGIRQWGNIIWLSMSNAFFDCENMEYFATDKPNLSVVTDTSNMFLDCLKFNGDLNNWDVENVVDMSQMFRGALVFNGDLGNWNVSNVFRMPLMFADTFSFEGIGLENWKVNEVLSMFRMFYNAGGFKTDISGWNVSKVFEMREIFSGATMFNHNLGLWNLSSASTGIVDNELVSSLMNMFDNSGLSQENYEATLIGWAEADTTPDNITLGAVGLTYCSDAAKAARNEVLIAQKGWTINGDTEDCN